MVVFTIKLKKGIPQGDDTNIAECCAARLKEEDILRNKGTWAIALRATLHAKSSLTDVTIDLTHAKAVT